MIEIEIWSDVMCPFCYIGKRRLDNALAKFAKADQVKILWRSFFLNPSLKTQPEKSLNEYLAEQKNWTLEYASEMNAYVSKMADDVGLVYNLEKAVVANTTKAHQFIQFAKTYEKANEMEESLFRAYFTEGKNIDDPEVLKELAIGIGLDEAKAKEVLEKKMFLPEIEKDIQRAREIGVSGVPFFVFNDKYTISGAQHEETIFGALEKCWEESDR